MSHPQFTPNKNPKKNLKKPVARIRLQDGKEDRGDGILRDHRGCCPPVYQWKQHAVTIRVSDEVARWHQKSEFERDWLAGKPVGGC